MQNLCFLIFFLSLSINNIIYADNIASTQPINNIRAENIHKSQPLANNQQNTSLKLYNEPNLGAKILAQIPIFQRLIPIYHQGDWLKVGDPSNGQVGWILITDYHNALINANKQTIQFVQLQYSQQGKPSYNLVAYRNGKKLPDNEAKKLYNDFIKRQQIWETQFNQWRKELNDELTMFNMLPEPIIIINQPFNKTKF